MSEMEIMEVAQRVRAMDEEEQQLVARNLPDDVMIDELNRRFNKTKEMVSAIRDIARVTNG